MKFKLFAAAAVLSTAAFGGDLLLDGGKFVPVRSTVAESFVDDMNFCFAQNFSDGEIHMNHSKGVHTVTEYGCMDISKDNGRTWTNNVKKVLGYSSWEAPDGTKMAVGIWQRNAAETHDLLVESIDKNGKYSSFKTPIKLPYKSSFHMHRNVIRLKNGDLMACAYGRKEKLPKAHTFVIKSSDEGKTWQFLSDVAEDPQGKTPEGPNESDAAVLPDGTVFICWRDGGTMKYAFSKDNGKTWGDYSEYKDLPMAVSPHCRVLANGTLVVVTGRPNLYALVDFTGTGKNFQKLEIYRGGGSSYGSVLEIAPNKILIIHDESSFCGIKAPTNFSRIVVEEFDVVKDSSIRKSSGDPRAKGFDGFYSAFDKKTPFEAIKAMPYMYKEKAKAPGYPATYEILQTPERPEPVLRLISRGKAEISPGSQWGNFSTQPLPKNVRKVSCVFEVRILDNDTDTPQIAFIVKVPDPASPDNSCYFAYARVAKDRVMFGEKTVKKENYLGKFAAFEVKVDAGSMKGYLYKLGETTPIATCDLVKGKSPANIIWGDGSSAIFGSADLSYIGWKFE